MKTGIVIGHNNGLGDLIVMNGCVRYLASQYDVTYLTCFDSRLKHYEFIYRNDENIHLSVKPHPKNSRQARLRQVSSYENIIEQNQHIDWSAGLRRTYWTTFEEWRKRLNELNLQESETIWPELFYAIMDVPYSARYEYYNLPRDSHRESELKSKLNLPEKYALCIDDTRKFKYNLQWQTSLPIVNPLSSAFWRDTLIFDWMQVIEGASEIHTVDTSWMHLIRMMQLNVPKFYYEVRELIMIGERYLNDSFDSGWTRITNNLFEQKQKSRYWLV